MENSAFISWPWILLIMILLIWTYSTYEPCDITKIHMKPYSSLITFFNALECFGTFWWLIFLHYWLKDACYWSAMNLLLNDPSSQRLIWLALRTLSIWSAEQESPLQQQLFPISLRLICGLPWKVFSSLTSVNQINICQTRAETYIYTCSCRTSYTRTNTVEKCNADQNTQISNNAHAVYTHNRQTKIPWKRQKRFILATFSDPNACRIAHRIIFILTRPHINTDTQQSTYLMLRKDRWVVVLIQNFNYHSAGAVQPCRKARLMVTSSQYHHSCHYI